MRPRRDRSAPSLFVESDALSKGKKVLSTRYDVSLEDGLRRPAAYSSLASKLARAVAAAMK